MLITVASSSIAFRAEFVCRRSRDAPFQAPDEESRASSPAKRSQVFVSHVVVGSWRYSRTILAPH